MIVYDPLNKLLKEKNLNKTYLQDQLNLSSRTIAKIAKNENISLSTLDNICNLLNCDIEDVIKHVPEG